MAECLGHDNEYNLETDAHMSRVYRTTKQREIVDYQTAYYRLKTHLTLSRTGGIQANIFNGHAVRRTPISAPGSTPIKPVRFLT